MRSRTTRFGFLVAVAAVVAVARPLPALIALAVPAAEAAGPAHIVTFDGVFRADDGGALYLRVVAGEAWGFAEHPGKGYAFVLHGTYAGDRITGRWWDVPKHVRTTTGDVELQISQGGDRIVRKSADAAVGVSVFTRIDPSQVPWPGTDREAGFQSTRRDDLDGKFIGADGSRFYVRELGGDVVGVGELRTGSNTRPTWAAVFAGKRSGNGDVAGSYADVPKGTRTAKGGFGLGLVTGKREGSISLAMGGGSRSLGPDYAIDFARMATLIDQALRNRVVGFGFAVSKDGAIVAEGAGGSRRLGQDDPTGRNQALAFDVTTQNEAASTSKLVTAAVLVRTLEELGISLDAKVAGAVPTCWTRGPGITNTIGGLTWMQLLNHTSRLTRPNECDNNPYECLRKSIAAGRVGPATDEKGNARQYQNINYTVLRYLIPTLRNKAGVNAIFAKYGCKRENGAKINAEVSELFRRHVSDDVLGKLGIQGSFEPVTEFALRYDFSRPTVSGIRPSYQDILEAGSGGMKWSAREYAKFLGALETGKIVSPQALRTMRSQLLGYDGTFPGAAGAYPWKNGGTSDARGVQSETVSFPSGVAAYVTVNSNNNNLQRSLGRILQSAFDGAIR
jgi:CubicO group peptidase (beta-lactamase class C family)